MTKNSQNDKTDKFRGKNRSRKRSRSERDPKNDYSSRDSIESSKDIVTNDPSWYMQYPSLLDSSANYKFNTPLGGSIDIGGAYSQMSVPGIMRFDTHVCPGLAIDVDSPINIQSRKLYTYMRALRSGSAQYDPSDVMAYLLAIDSAYCYYFAMKRLVGTVNRADVNNRYLPSALVSAQGFNYDELQKNVANLTTYLQTYVTRLSSFFIPADMTLLARHSTIFSNIYMDKASAKAQYYLYNPSGYYKYVEVADTMQPASLKFVRFTKVVNTLEDIYTMGESLIRPLVNSGDINQISTDIYHAFKDRGLYTVADIPMYYMFEPVYDVEMLNQLQNARSIGQVDTDDIVQDVDKGILVFNPKVYGPTEAVGAQLYTNDTLLSVEYGYTDTPHVMTSTRLCVSLSFNTSTKKLQIESVGSEFIEGIHVYDFIWNQNTRELRRQELEKGVLVVEKPVEDLGLQQLMNAFSVTTTFDFHPMINIWLKVDANTYKHLGLNYDFDYVTVLDKVELNKLHSAALLSEFFVPQP